MMDNYHKPADKILELDPYPILSSAFDGDILFMNPSARKALRDSRQTHVNALLPGNHRDVVRACIKTNSSVQAERAVSPFRFAWSYQPVSSEKNAYIFGVDVSVYQKYSAADFSEESLALQYQDIVSSQSLVSVQL